MQSSGTQSAYAVPIFIEAEFWGLMFMDYCHELRLLTPPELAVFSTAATCVGSAIHREQMSRDRQQAEHSALLSQERNRLAREIHDTLAQTFTGVSLQLEAAKGILKQQPQEANLYITHAGDLARRGLSEARRSVHALRAQALENDTLPAVLQESVKELTQNSSLKGDFQQVGSPYPLSADLQNQSAAHQPRSHDQRAASCQRQASHYHAAIFARPGAADYCRRWTWLRAASARPKDRNRARRSRWLWVLLA